MVPSKIFMTKGIGVHKDRLSSFELALRDAGIENLILSQFPAFYRQTARLYQKMRD